MKALKCLIMVLALSFCAAEYSFAEKFTKEELKGAVEKSGGGQFVHKITDFLAAFVVDHFFIGCGTGVDFFIYGRRGLNVYIWQKNDEGKVEMVPYKVKFTSWQLARVGADFTCMAGSFLGAGPGIDELDRAEFRGVGADADPFKAIPGANITSKIISFMKVGGTIFGGKNNPFMGMAGIFGIGFSHVLTDVGPVGAVGRIDHFRFESSAVPIKNHKEKPEKKLVKVSRDIEEKCTSECEGEEKACFNECVADN